LGSAVDTSTLAFMDLALAEAARGLGRTHPNPAVGAVLVQGGVVVGRGHHRRAGLPHAEVEAIRDAGDKARGADLYVTLEPHDHHGKTPPCTLAIIDAGVRRVFVGATDPNPLVSGRGLERLRAAGVEVVEGVRREACEALVRPFATHVTKGRPYVVLKVASTLDGKLATASGDSKWITSEAARALVHRWRDELDAVLVGAGTVVADDPLLTARLPAPAVEGRTPRNPLRVVLSGRLRLPLSAQLFDVSAAPTLVYTAYPKGVSARALRERGVEVADVRAQDERVDVAAMLEDLGRRGVTSLLVEGGAEVHAAMLEAGVVDEIRLFLAPKVVGAEGVSWLGALGVARMAEAWRLVGARLEPVGADWLVTGRPERSA
jgi:diaminohydroxyphosphoribosylaminopyrimidine deaminase/5-amino-6-(5-phosphoribosylamino)uracil reductase